MRGRWLILSVGITVMVVVLGLGLTIGTRSSPEGPHVEVPQAKAAERFPIGVSFGDTLRSLSDADLASALDDVVALHANWIRIDLSWTRIQPISSAAYDWLATDRVVKAARARNLEVLGILTFTPAWARQPGCVTFSCPPRSADQFATFARAAAQRYGPKGIAGYEVWNEPNLAQFWTTPDAKAYSALLAATVPAIHDGEPSATVLLGGLAANRAGTSVIQAPTFLTDVCSTGVCKEVDGIGYHPYTFPLTALARSAQVTAWQRITQPSSAGPSLREILRADGLGDKKIWVTEYGAPSDEFGSGCACVDDEAQAHIISSGITAAVSAPGLIGAIFIYSWKDLGYGSSIEDHFGLLRFDGTHKPSFDAFERAAARR